MVKRYPELLTDFPQATQIVIKKISNRIDSGKNALIGVFGQTGSGKSISVIKLMQGINLYRFGEEPTDEYLIDHTFFRASKFMEAMKGISDTLEAKEKKIKKGECWLWDEVGVEAGHKEAMTLRNRVVGWLAQTFRNLQQIVFFTTPSISFIDASVRKLLHYSFEAVSIDRKRKVCVIKPLEMQYNTRMDKIYYHNFKYPTKEGMVEVDLIGVKKISNELEELYEDKKNQFTKNLNDEIHEALLKIENKQKQVINRPEHQDIYEVYHTKSKIQVEMAEILNKNKKTLSAVMQTMDRWYPNWRRDPNLLGNLGNLDKPTENPPPQLKLSNPPT